MAANVLVDAGFLVAVLTERDSNHRWAAKTAEQHSPPWTSCDAVLSEAFYLLGRRGAFALTELLLRNAIATPFQFRESSKEVLGLIRKYADVPMSFADACLVRMTEMLPDPLLLTTDADFRIYRRHSRQIVPCVMPR